MDLLEKASIILTPTAYNNGEALCVKPSDGSGDFDFSRNSAATRVNAQGLVENVQILSSNLVQNGDFSEQGSEQIVNGTFDENVNGWVVNNANATFVWQPDKTALFTSTSFGYVRVFPSLNLNAAIYKVSFDILSFDGTLSNVHIGLGTNGNVVSAIGSYTYYYTSTGGSTEFQIRPNSGGTGSIKIDNISVKEVGQNWTLDSGWSIGDDKVIGTAATGDSYQDLNFAGTKTFKITFDCVVDSGQFAIRFINKQWISASGTYTIYETTTSSRLFIDGRASFPFTGSVTNISVIEITDDTNLPRINYEGFSYQDVLGSELVTNGDFATDSNWVKGTGWSISGGLLTCDGTQTSVSQVYQFGVITLGLTYQITFTISNYSSGTIRAGADGSWGSYYSANGTYTYNITSAGTLFIIQASSSFIGSIDNVSVKEVLGQEVVPDSGCGSWLFEPQSTNLITQSELFSDSSWTKNNSSVTSGFSSPDGANNAFNLNISISSGYLLTQLFSYSAVLGQSITASIFAKNEITNFLSFGGATVSGTDIYSIQDYGNGWFRHIVTRTFTTTATGGVQFVIYDQVGDNVIWGAQLEEDYATSYIPTSGTSVTRNQDVCTNGGSVSTINSTEGVLYVEDERLSLLGNKRTISISDGSLNNHLYIQFQGVSNTVRVFYKTIEFGQVLLLNHNLSNELGLNKYAFKWSNNNFSLWVNGIKEIEQLSGNTSSLNIFNSVDFELGNAADKFFGKTKALAVWKEALSDEELQSLTTI